jgi:hypothetical protein
MFLPNGITSQKIVILVIVAVRTWNLIFGNTMKRIMVD